MRQRDYAECDMSQVDDLAVDFVCNGTTMKLNRDERVEAVRRMMNAGRVMARRMRTYNEEVTRIMRALGAVKCPVCFQLEAHRNGVINRHVDSLGNTWCPMSGHSYDDPESIAPRRSWHQRMKTAANA